MIRFHNVKFTNAAGLAEFIQSQKGFTEVKGTKIIVRRDWKRDADKLKGAHAIAGDLARLAKSRALPCHEFMKLKVISKT